MTATGRTHRSLEALEHAERGVGVELAGGEVRECLVVEVTNRELLAMLRLDDDDDDDDERAGAVGREREQLPARQQLALGIKGADATDAQSPPAEGGLGDLRMSSAGSYLARLQGCVGSLRQPVAGRSDRPRCRPLPAFGASAWVSRGARFDEPCLVGVDDGLGAVAEVELGVDTCDVGLDGRVADDQLGGDLGVGVAAGDELEPRARAG
jgi:hypothetical protein